MSMGCDIHTHAERTFDNNWDDTTIFHAGGELDIERSYSLFGYLAGVRGGEEPIVQPKGIPKWMSAETKKDLKSWDGDAHTPSWLTFKELKKLPTVFRKEPFYLYVEALAKEHGEENVRIVFWFDN